MLKVPKWGYTLALLTGVLIGFILFGGYVNAQPYYNPHYGAKEEKPKPLKPCWNCGAWIPKGEDQCTKCGAPRDKPKYRDYNPYYERRYYRKY